MGALRELSSLLAENAELLTNKVAVLASLCPPPGVLKQNAVKVTARHMNGILAIAQFLAQSDGGQHREQLFEVVLEFLRSVPTRTKSSIWPSTFSSEAASGYFPELLSYVVKIADSDTKAAQDVSNVIAGVIQQVSAGGDVEGVLSSYPGAKAFIAALGKICPNLHSSDSEEIILCLLDHWIQSSQSGALVISSSEASGTGSPMRSYLQAPYRNGFKTPRKSSESDGFEQADSKGVSPSSESRNHVTFFSPSSTVSATPIFTPISTPLKLSGEQTPVVRSGPVSGPIDEEGIYGRLPVPPLKGAFNGAPGFKRHQPGLAIESVCALEKQEIAYRLLARILEKAESGSNAKILHIQQLRTNTIKQLKSLLPILKIRKRDWTTDVLELEAKVNMLFQASQAASVLQVKCIFLLDSDGKLLKAALRESLPLLMDAADACISSPWRRRSKGCEDLFDSLITGVAHIAALHRSQMQRILLRFKVLVLTACAQANTWGTTLGSSFESIIRGSCILIEVGWKSDRPAVESFLLALAAQIREKDKGERASQGAAMMQLNVISFLADLSISLNKPEVVELILPIFVESLEEGDAASPSLLRLKLLEAVGRMACLGCEKSYREVVVLLTRSYLDKLSTVGSSLSRTTPSEGTTERLETLPAAFLQIARGLKQPALRMDYRQRLLALCSDVGLVAEAKNGRSGADLLGPLLSAVAEMSVDFDPTKDVDPSLLKLFRNLWFYIALFALAPPLQKGPLPTKSGAIVNHISMGQSQAIPAGLSMGFSTGSLPLQAVAGPYAWNPQWSAAAERITQGTPPLVVSSVKWLEDELELNSLLNPGSSRGGYNDKASSAQRTALSAALGGRVETSSLSTISGVKATYLLAVAFLEVLRFRNCGGVMRISSSEGEYTSALCFAFKYLETPSLTPAVQQCLVAIVHQAFGAAMSWLADRASAIGKDGEEREAVIVAHACFLIRITSHREEYIRELADALLNQLKSKFSQVLWNPRCLNELLLLATGSKSSTSTSDFGSSAPRQLTHQKVREWIVQALLLVPCTMQGLLQEQLRKLNSWQSATSEVLSLLSEIRLDVTKADPHTGMACIPAVTAAAAAAAGVNPKLAQTGTVEVLSTGIISANIKSNYSGEIAGMKRLYVGMGGLAISPPSYVHNVMRVRMPYGPAKKDELQDPADHVQDLALNEMLTTKFVQQLQQFFTAAEKGLQVDAAAFREACLRGAALLLSDLGTCKEFAEGESHLLRLLCWCPAHVFTPEAMETGVFVWTWILSAAPQLGSRVLGELVDAWMWTVDTRKGLFASGIENSGPAAKLRPELTPGEPGPSPSPDPVRGINAHRVWLGFLLDRFEVIRHGCSDQLLLFGRFLQGSISKPLQFTSHPAAAGAFFTLMLFSLKYCACQTQLGSLVEKSGAVLLEDAVYRAGLSWFSVEPGWFDSNMEGFAQAEALTVTRFLQQLTSDRSDTTAQEEVTVSCAVRKRSQDFGPASTNGVAQMKAQLEAAQFLKAKVDGETAMKERRKQLLLMLCQHEAERLDTWAHPLKESLPRWRVSADQWAEYVKTAWSVDPRIALALVARFPGVGILRTEVSSLVQGHVQELFDIPEALPYIVTPRAVEENSAVLQKLSHWAPCSITCALEFLTPPYKGHPRVMAYVLRVLETYPPERVTFFMPQLVQSLRYDHGGLVEGYLLGAAQISNLFAHILIWQLQGEEAPSSEEAIKEPAAASAKGNLYEIVPRVRKRIIDGFSPEAYDVFLREFRFFDKVTSISGALYPLHKDERRAAIRRELEKIEVEGEELYLPTAPDMLVRGIKLDSGIPLQSAAKVPIMITFDVVDKDGDHSDVKAQACIFKVGDDCRQDVLALQVIALMKKIFEAVGLNLYLFPYGVLPTGYGRGIIEVVPDTRSRNQMGEITDGGLYEIFQQEYGPVGFPGFEKARDNFIVSSAGYAVASLLLQPKDRHNGNLLFDSEGRLVHIDFGFILETSPGGNIRFESAQFKLSHEMTQLLDPSGSMKSETWYRFVSLCVKGYLAAREHMDGIINTVLLMVDSGLPCFSRGDPIGNLRKRFHPEMSEREAANFMIKTCKDAYNKWTTAGYDLIQHIQQGIEM